MVWVLKSENSTHAVYEQITFGLTLVKCRGIIIQQHGSLARNHIQRPGRSVRSVWNIDSWKMTSNWGADKVTDQRFDRMSQTQEDRQGYLRAVQGERWSGVQMSLAKFTWVSWVQLNSVQFSWMQFSWVREVSFSSFQPCTQYSQCSSGHGVQRQFFFPNSNSVRSQEKPFWISLLGEESKPEQMSWNSQPEFRKT